MNIVESARRGVLAHTSPHAYTASHASATRTRATLSPARQGLLELLQRINFGTIEGLELRDGEPVLAPAPRLVRTIKIGGRAYGPRLELGRTDFALKAQIIELFEHFDCIRNGTVTINVHDGLPTQITVEHQS